MRKTIEIDGKDYTIRSVRWGERHLAQEKQDESTDDHVEKIVKLCVCDNIKLDEIDTWVIYKLYREISQLSYMGPDEAKNLDGQPTSLPTESSTVAENAGKES